MTVSEDTNTAHYNLIEVITIYKKPDKTRHMTRHKKTLSIILMVLMLFFAAAAVQADTRAEELCRFMDETLSIDKKIPSYIPYSDEVFTIYTDPDRVVVGSIVIEDKTVISFGCEASEEPTYEVFVYSKEVVEEIMASERPVNALNKALKEGTIDVKAQSLGGKIKTAAARFITRIAAWFG